MNAILGNAIDKATSSSLATASALVPRSLRSKAAPSSSGGNSNTTSSANGSDITSNDFLTLLVSELKNQDPTQPTDPNAYIQQLVGVNSLQQLIQINQGVSAIKQGGMSASGTSSAS